MFLHCAVLIQVKMIDIFPSIHFCATTSGLTAFQSFPFPYLDRADALSDVFGYDIYFFYKIHITQININPIN